MDQKKIIILIVVIFALVIPLLIAAVVGAVYFVARSESFFESDQVGLIRVDGIITAGQGSQGIFSDGSVGSERIVSLLKDFRKDKDVDTLVVRINSPGGSAAGSQDIYHEILKVRENGKNVIISMGDVAASGGYYIASAADKIYASPATITGSIGVILQTADMEELLDRIGIDFETIKSGEFKDTGSFSRSMTDRERQLLQVMIDDIFDQFVTHVSEGRDMPREEVLKVADGRIFTGRQAHKLELVDEIGTFEDSLREAADLSGIAGEYSVKEYGGRASGFLDWFIGYTGVELPKWLRGGGNSLMDISQRILQADQGLIVK